MPSLKRIKKLRPKDKKKIILASLIATLGFIVLITYLVAIKPFGLTLWEGYTNLASSYIRIVKIDPGMRREEVADRFAKTFSWTPEERKQFMDIHTRNNGGHIEGYYFPGTYLIPVKAQPEEASNLILKKFNERILSNKDKLKNNVVNLDTAIKIASIIQKEAGKDDKNIVSGVIWNRMFQGMSLDMDATLQYVKGTEKKWWPQVDADDKYINSPYNTYKNKGLPPSAISNPSEEAIWAALNPQKSDIVFYIHDERGKIHTARTYQEHLANIDRYY